MAPLYILNKLHAYRVSGECYPIFLHGQWRGQDSIPSGGEGGGWQMWNRPFQG